MVRSSRFGIPIVVLLGLLFGLVGCDLMGEDANVTPLLGAWRMEDLSVDGVSVKAQLDAQYAHLVLTLREGANGGTFFTMIGRQEGRSEDLVVQGTFDVDPDLELTLFPDTGSPVELTYALPDSVDTALRLSAEEGASEDHFLDLIRLPIQGAVDRVELRLSKGAPASGFARGVPAKGSR